VKASALSPGYIYMFPSAVIVVLLSVVISGTEIGKTSSYWGSIQSGKDHAYEREITGRIEYQE
jgi:hypothetical protein